MALQVNAGFSSNVAYSWNIESDNVSKVVFVLDKLRNIVFLCLGMLLWCTVSVMRWLNKLCGDKRRGTYHRSTFIPPGPVDGFVVSVFGHFASLVEI